MTTSRPAFSKHAESTEVLTFSAIGRVPPDWNKAVIDFCDNGNSYHRAWHGHFGRFSNGRRSNDVRLFLEDDISGALKVPPENRAGFLDHVRGNHVILHTSASHINTEVRKNQALSFIYQIRRELGPETQISLVMTKGYGDRIDRDFIDSETGLREYNACQCEEFAEDLVARGVSRLVMLEPHSLDATKIFARNLGPQNVLFPTTSAGVGLKFLQDEGLRKQFPQAYEGQLFAVASPDGGEKGLDTTSAIRAWLVFQEIYPDYKNQALTQELYDNDSFVQENFIRVQKKRTNSGNERQTEILSGDAKNKIVCIVDDIASSAKTAIKAGHEFMEAGACGVAVYVAHGEWEVYRDGKENGGYPNALHRILRAEHEGNPLVAKVFVGTTIPRTTRSMPQLLSGLGGSVQNIIIDGQSYKRTELVHCGHLAVPCIQALHEMANKRQPELNMPLLPVPELYPHEMRAGTQLNPGLRKQ